MLHTNLDVAKSSFHESIFELTVTFKVCISEWILNIADKWVFLAKLKIVFDKLLGCGLHLDSLNLILVCVFRVFVVQTVGIAVNPDLKDILSDYVGSRVCFTLSRSLSISFAFATKGCSNAARRGGVSLGA